MKTRDEVIALFQNKYEYLKAVYPFVGPFDENRLYQNPDGGWQMNLENCAAITLRPNDAVPHETHGPICARWYQQGRAFDDAGIPGWLGYPISDVEKRRVDCLFPAPKNSFPNFPPFPSKLMISGVGSNFEFGTIDWPGECSEIVYDGCLHLPNHKSIEEYLQDNYDVRSPSCPPAHTSLNEAGRHHVPHDIANAFEIFLAQCKIIVKERFSCVCDMENQHPVWVFRANVEGYEDFSIQIWREGPPGREGANIHALIKSIGTEEKCEEFVVPNLFRITPIT